MRDALSFLHFCLIYSLDFYNIMQLLEFESVQLSEEPRQDKQFKEILGKELKSSLIKLQGGSYEYYHFQKVFQVVPVISAETISFKRNYRPQILHDFLSTSFPNLLEINIAQNRIVSVEPLTFLKAPKLESLILSENRLSSLKNIRKLPFILAKLELDGNPLRQLSGFECIRFQKTVKSIQLEMFNSLPCIAEDLSVLMKIQAQEIKSIRIKKRINNEIVIKSLNSRVPSSLRPSISYAPY